MCRKIFSSRVVLCEPNSHIHSHTSISLPPTGGDGRFGRMYECHNVKTGERMVVKEIIIQEKDRYQVQEAVLKRTDALRKLEHPNVLKFIGVEFRDVSDVIIIRIMCVLCGQLHLRRTHACRHWYCHRQSEGHTRPAHISRVLCLVSICVDEHEPSHYAL